MAVGGQTRAHSIGYCSYCYPRLWPRDGTEILIVATMPGQISLVLNIHGVHIVAKLGRENVTRALTIEHKI